MKSNKLSHPRRLKAKAFDSSITALASLAGLPTRRRVRRAADGETIIEGTSIDMTAFTAGISDLLRQVREN